MVVMHPDHGDIGASDSDLRKLANFMSKKEYEYLKEAPQRLRDRGHRLSAEDVRMPDVFRVQGCENEHVVLMELKRWMVDYNFWWHDETGQIAEDELYKKGYTSLSVHEYLKMTKQKQLVYCYGKALKVLREWQDIKNKKELQLELDAAPATSAPKIADALLDDSLRCGGEAGAPAPYAPVPCGQPLESGFNDVTLSASQLVGDTCDGIPANALEEMNDSLREAKWIDLIFEREDSSHSMFAKHRVTRKHRAIESLDKIDELENIE